MYCLKDGYVPLFLITAALVSLFAEPLLAEPTGPTLRFGYNSDKPLDNPLCHFMYFVPLVSPEQVAECTNVGNTQCAEVLTCHCHTNGQTFHATCDFEFVGNGLDRNTFGHTVIIQRKEKELKSGKPLAHQLSALSVEGVGCGSIEIDGTLTNGLTQVDDMRIRFNAHGHSSPVTIDLQDIVLRDGTYQYENDMVARVNSLTFHRMAGTPKMEVTLASVRRKDAGNSAWSKFVGGIKGEMANMLLPPLTVTTNGNQTMLEFGLSLAMQKPSFTFPYASRLTNAPAIAL